MNSKNRDKWQVVAVVAMDDESITYSRVSDGALKGWARVILFVGVWLAVILGYWLVVFVLQIACSNSICF